MNKWPRTTFAIFATLLAIVLLKTLVFLQLRIADNSLSPTFRQGDCVLIYRLPYTISSLSILNSSPSRGDWIAFLDPLPSKASSNSSICLGRISRLSTDTVWIVAGKKSHPLVIPHKGTTLDVTPWNIHLLANTLRLHEGCNVCEDGDSTLIVNGEPLQRVRFTQDYIWISVPAKHTAYDSRTFGFVPVKNIVGRMLRRYRF